MNNALKLARNIGISIVCLLVVVVGGFVGYTWYVGENGTANPQAFQTPASQNTKPKVDPVKISQTANIGASVQTITSPVKPGSNSSIMVRTNPEATCVISVEYNKVPSKDSGLVQKKSDDFGIVEWTWTVESTVPLGKWPVKVTCANQKNSAVVVGDLEVVKELE